MRYYSISVYPQATNSTPSKTWSSFPNGKIDPGALQVEIDILTAFLGIPGGDPGASTVTIHGIPLSDLLQAQNYYGSILSVYGGMQKGLPLANPAQAGLLVQGRVFQAFANWQGDDMNLNFTLVPSGQTLNTPGNFVFVWSKGQALYAALQTALQVVYPSSQFKIRMQIGSNYATAQTIAHKCSTLTEFAKFIYSLTGGGVNITMWNYATVLVTDNSVQSNMVKLNFSDLIGQPKWVAQNVVQFVTVMRADIQVNTTIMMPQGLPNAPGTVTTTAASTPSQLKYKTSFQGSFVVQSARHVGNFRDPDGASWASIFEAYPNA